MQAKEMTRALCRQVQLHEEIHIFYRVCDPKYEATLYAYDGAVIVATVGGETPMEALENLEMYVKDHEQEIIDEYFSEKGRVAGD